MLMTVECQFNAARAFIGDYYVTGDNRPLFGGDRSPADIRVGILQQGGGMTMLTRAELGALGERLAADHLTGLGLQIVARNWRCRYGELDLIAWNRETLVFVEVKSRASGAWSAPERDIDNEKILALRRAARDYIRRAEADASPARFDVLSIVGERVYARHNVHDRLCSQSQYRCAANMLDRDANISKRRKQHASSIQSLSYHAGGN